MPQTGQNLLLSFLAADFADVIGIKIHTHILHKPTTHVTLNAHLVNNRAVLTSNKKNLNHSYVKRIFNFHGFNYFLF